MKERSLSRLVHAVFAIGAVVGMSAVSAQGYQGAVSSELSIQVVAAGADPEGEVGNGTNPPSANP